MLENIFFQILEPTQFSMLLRFTAPILLASIGGLFCHEVGETNIGLEGAMLISAFISISVNAATGSWLIGLTFGVISSVILNLILALFSLRYNVHIIIAGFVINIFASGLTIFLMKELFGVLGAYVPKNIQLIPKISLPFFEKLPVLEKLINNQNLVIWLALISVIIAQIVYYKTVYGIHIRAIGENINAAESLGIKINIIKYSTFVWCGIFCGIAGAFLSTSTTSMFVRDMTAGTGFVALAVLLLGNSKPLGILFGSLLFGFTNSIVILIQTTPNISIPSGFIQAIPYIVTVVVVFFYSMRKNSGFNFSLKKIKKSSNNQISAQ